jgi:hypothetical protein
MFFNADYLVNICLSVNLLLFPKTVIFLCNQTYYILTSIQFLNNKKTDMNVSLGIICHSLEWSWRLKHFIEIHCIYNIGWNIRPYLVQIMSRPRALLNNSCVSFIFLCLRIYEIKSFVHIPLSLCKFILSCLFSLWFPFFNMIMTSRNDLKNYSFIMLKLYKQTQETKEQNIFKQQRLYFNRN